MNDSSCCGRKADSLHRIFELQYEFNKKVGLDSAEILKRKVDEGSEFVASFDQKEWLGKMHLAMSQELAEFRDSIPWKWWKAQKFDEQNAKVEVIDMMHFLVSMALLLGMTPEDFVRVYEEKMKVNLKRQEGDYATNPNATGGSVDCKHIT